MAILKRRLHRKNASGGYDVVYLQTTSDLVLMSDGTTTLTSKISSMDSTINGKAASNHTHSGYAAASHSHPDANTSAAGFMTPAMVSKLNGIAAGANAYNHPSAKQCSYAYTHPTTKQCNYSVDTSTFATKAYVDAAVKKVNGTSWAAKISTFQYGRQDASVTINPGFTASYIHLNVSEFKITVRRYDSDGSTLYGNFTFSALIDRPLYNNGTLSITGVDSAKKLSINITFTLVNNVITISSSHGSRASESYTQFNLSGLAF